MIRAVALWLVLTLPAAAMTIYEDHGGNLGEYADRFNAAAFRGERIVVDGLCISACTLVLALRHVCVTPRARFGFHRAFIPDRRGAIDSPEGSAYLWSHYPATVRARLGSLTRRMKYLPGSATGLPRCR